MRRTIVCLNDTCIVPVFVRSLPRCLHREMVPSQGKDRMVHNLGCSQSTWLAANDQTRFPCESVWKERNEKGKVKSLKPCQTPRFLSAKVSVSFQNAAALLAGHPESLLSVQGEGTAF